MSWPRLGRRSRVSGHKLDLFWQGLQAALGLRVRRQAGGVARRGHTPDGLIQHRGCRGPLEDVAGIMPSWMLLG